MKRKAKKIEILSDLRPDRGNVNKGTERGNFQLDWSLSNFGAWRSIAASADGVVAAGNQTLLQAADHGLKIRPVHTNGDELVVVIRDDIKSDDPRFRQYAIADNRISELNYSADVEMLLSHQAAGVDLSPMWLPEEIDGLIASLTPDMKDEFGFNFPDSNTDDADQVSMDRPAAIFPLGITVSAAVNREWREYKEENQLKSDSEAFLFLWQQQ